MSPGTDHLAERILVLAPTGRDAPLICTVLRQANLFAQRCGDIAELCAALEGGAAAVLITEEALDPASLKKLIEALERQPSWSDIPILLLTGREFAESSVRPLRFLGPLRNVTLLERPIRLLILISAVRVALRARKRQYELRDYLEEREKTAVERTAMLQREHEAREAAEAANRMKDEFLATVSHELRTPLNAILGWTSILKTERYDPAKAGRALDIVERNARAQVQLIEDLLDLSRVVTGKLRLEPKPLHVVPLVEAAVETIRPAAAAKGIVLEMKSAPEIEEILGDGDRLHQVIWNLLSNAVKFTPEGGRVRVDVERLETQIEIQVGDTGVGISPEFLPHIFERFRQADSAPTRAHGGLGLGLAIVRHLVELHGGIVEAASPGKGLGSRFTVRLPVRPVGPVDAAPETPPRWDEPRRQPERLDGLRILVVDDERDARELIAAVFEELGATVAQVTGSDDAMAVVHGFHPEVIIADVGMPGGDGYSLLRTIRSFGPERGGSIRAIAVTSYARAEDKQRALEAGFDLHMAKPVDVPLLIDAVTGVRRISVGADDRMKQ